MDAPPRPSHEDDVQGETFSLDKTSIPLPFPQRVVPTSRKMEEVDKEILDTFRKVKVNIPLLYAIKQIPRYAKFLKDLCTHKRCLKGNEKVNMGRNVSALIEKVNMGRNVSAHIIGSNKFENAMLDLGASINVMPLSVSTSLSLGPLKPTGVVIQLANSSTVQPAGLIEDVFIQVNKLVFPADFYILDMGGEDSHSGATTIILGRPFLKTTRTKIDVHAGTLTMECGDSLVQFNILDAMKHPVEDHFGYHLDILDDIMDDIVLDFLEDYDLSDLIDWTNSDIDEFISSDGLNCSNLCDAGFATKANVVDTHLTTLNDSNPDKLQVAEVSLSNRPLPSIIQSPSLELKPLPDHLKYAYLEKKEQLPVIISTALSDEQEQKLLQVIREHKKAIGWTLADIPGISPAICMHRILLEEGTKLVRQPQRRLNPQILDVVKKVVTKQVSYTLSLTTLW